MVCIELRVFLIWWWLSKPQLMENFQTSQMSRTNQMLNVKTKCISENVHRFLPIEVENLSHIQLLQPSLAIKRIWFRNKHLWTNKSVDAALARSSYKRGVLGSQPGQANTFWYYFKHFFKNWFTSLRKWRAIIFGTFTLNRTCNIKQ